MRVFVAGASGAIGARLVSQLIAHGHQVTGSHRSAGRAGRIRALGAEPVALDLLDARAVREAVLAARPEAIVHQATALAGARFGGPHRSPSGYGRRLAPGHGLVQRVAGVAAASSRAAVIAASGEPAPGRASSSASRPAVGSRAGRVWGSMGL